MVLISCKEQEFANSVPTEVINPQVLQLYCEAPQTRV